MSSTRDSMRLVIVESPYAPQTAIRDRCHRSECGRELDRNIRYARAALRDCVLRGESPYASHLLYTQVGVLDDNIPADRELGIRAGCAWRSVAVATVVYSDLGISKGMQYGIDDALRRGVPVEYRSIVGWQR